MVNANEPFHIAGVQGEQYHSGHPEYELKRHQYAQSSYPERVSPSMIIYATGIEDIKATVRYARDNGIAIAIRTGGHQYSGASSTSGRNIQLDLSQTFKDDPYNKDDLTPKKAREHLVYNKEKGAIRCGVSHNIVEFDSFLAANKIFAPHGHCSGVNIGGHVQSGGYGQLGRSFGLLGDHIIEIEMVDYTAELKYINKEKNPELFWAILGGSPGNFGVITHYTIKANKDEDYEGSMGQKCLFQYSAKTISRLLQILAKLSDDPSLSRNYDMCINVISATADIKAYFPKLGNNFRGLYPDDPSKATPPRQLFISTWAQWVPFSGVTDTLDSSLWFEEIAQNAIYIEDLGYRPQPGATPWPTPPVSRKPMSELTCDWMVHFEREFDYPYTKSLLTTNSTTLIKDGWVEWMTNRIHAIAGTVGNGNYLVAQLQPFGGQSKFAADADTGTSYSFRDSTMLATLDCWYDEKVPGSKQRAEEWHAENAKEIGHPTAIFCKEDRRMLWGSFGSYDLDADWEKYFAKADYEKIKKLRAQYDPDSVFTPNTFCVGYRGGKEYITN